MYKQAGTPDQASIKEAERLHKREKQEQGWTIASITAKAGRTHMPHKISNKWASGRMPADPRFLAFCSPYF